MILSPMAVRRLNDVTAYNYYPDTTHAQRNEFARMFKEEAARLLDQKAESTIKRAVELYGREDISYEQYMEMIEEVCKEEEEARGAAYGGEYARNRAFDFAQKTLDRVKEQAYNLSLIDAKRQYELERQKTEQSLKAVVQQYLADVQTITQQHDTELKTIAEEQKEELIQNQGEIIERTKTAIEQIILIQLQDERLKREQEIREEEVLRPVREAAQMAAERVAALEKKRRTHQRIKGGLVAVVLTFIVILWVALIFFPFPQWGTAIAIPLILLIVAIAYFWKNPIPEDKITAHRL